MTKRNDERDVIDHRKEKGGEVNPGNDPKPLFELELGRAHRFDVNYPGKNVVAPIRVKKTGPARWSRSKSYRNVVLSLSHVIKWLSSFCASNQAITIHFAFRKLLICGHLLRCIFSASRIIERKILLLATN